MGVPPGNTALLRRVLLIAFLIRTLVFIIALAKGHDYSVFRSSDTATYIMPAVALWSHGEFSVGGEPELSRTPGYPVFLLPGLLVGNVELVTLLLQVLVSCLTVYLVFRLAVLVTADRTIALLASLLYAVEPLSILYSVKILSETLFTFLVVAFLCYLVTFLQTNATRAVLIAATALAAATYVRPASYFLPILVTLGLPVVLLRARRGKILLHCSLFLAVSMGTVVIWQIRNALTSGYTGLSTITAHNLYYYGAAAVLSSQQGVPLEEMQRHLGMLDDERYLLRHPEQRRLSRSDRWKSMQSEAIKIILDDPVTFGIIRIKGMLKVLFNPGGAEYMTLFGVYAGAGTLVPSDGGLIDTAICLVKSREALFWTNVGLGLVLAVYYLLTAVSASSRRYSLSTPVLTLLAAIAYFVLVSEGGSRFRHPIMPVLCVFAGYGLAHIGDWWTRRRARLGGT